jgi:hypothetical protein
VPVLLRINRAFKRHRRVTVLAGAIIVLGVAALSTHAALPGHHDAGEGACACALAIATIGGALGWGFGRPLLGPLLGLRCVPVVHKRMTVLADPRLRGIARAGPAGPVIRRR